MATCGDLTVFYGANELDKLIQNFEFENQQYVKLIEKENQLIEALEKEEAEKRSEILRFQEETSRLDEDTKKAHKQFTHNRDHCESLKKTGVVLTEHDLALNRKLNSLKCSGEAEKQERKNVLKQYQTVYLDYERKYKSFPRVKKYLALQEKIAEREKVLTQDEETLKNLQQQIEEARGNDDINFNDLKEFIIKLVQLKVDSEKVLSQIKLYLDEKSNLEKELAEIREKESQNVDQTQELCERTEAVTMRDESSESVSTKLHKACTPMEDTSDDSINRRRSGDQACVEVEMLDGDSSVNNPMMTTPSRSVPVSVRSQPDHRQQIPVKTTDFQLSVQSHDGVYKGYLNKNQNNMNTGITPNIANRFPLLENLQITARQQTSNFRRQTTDIQQQTPSVQQQTASVRQQTTDIQQQTTDSQQQTTAIQQQTTNIQQQTNNIQQQTNNIRQQTNDIRQQTNDIRQLSPQIPALTCREGRQMPTLVVPRPMAPGPSQKTFQNYKSMPAPVPRLIHPFVVPRSEPQSPLTKAQLVTTPVTPRPVSTASSGLQTKPAECEPHTRVPSLGNQRRFSSPSTFFQPPSTEKPNAQESQTNSSTPLPRFLLPALPDYLTNLSSKQSPSSPMVASPIQIQKEVQQEWGSSQKTTKTAPSKSLTSKRMSYTEDEYTHEYSVPKTPKPVPSSSNESSSSPFDLQKHRQQLENLKSKSPGGPTFTSRPMFECEIGQMDTDQDAEPASFFQPFCKDTSVDSPSRLSNSNKMFVSSPVPGTTIFSQKHEQNRAQEMQSVCKNDIPSMSLFDKKETSPQTKQTFESGFFSLFGSTPASPPSEELSFSFGFGGQETAAESPEDFSFSFGGSSNNDNNSSPVLNLF
ncbi:uncharacterized protein LOC121390201 [Gigantopelta aegis]|uniref:uncharacterized protein LOC121390201 n=1 Tax=Gigantopelta aegis TaxID=1735272 RepID=UPI001B88ADA2|nr:uncharacterized protein LOC121390201 [Gigantopelta aegis]XP_041377900.1 uncharacterized protein LOC121390201 [Gigantopelta aegis]XP_041377901.1 uncharacterized protein LOC121390201 [Gigantopelta aegis]XP_041377902.1 uncharacterized protein LOC121390201 [Gigantopelta aegis]